MWGWDWSIGSGGGAGVGNEGCEGGIGLEIFAEQSIDGEVLVECDEPKLQHELGMDSKVDRIRLMKTISGQYSALGVLRGDYISIIMCQFD